MRYFRFLCSIILLASSSVAVATIRLTPAMQCETLGCVRKNIDQIDAQMVYLIGQRLSYVKRAGELKKGKQPIHDQSRENQIFDQVKKLAIKAGYSPGIAIAVYRALLVQTNQYEKINVN